MESRSEWMMAPSDMQRKWWRVLTRLAPWLWSQTTMPRNSLPQVGSGDISQHQRVKHKLRVPARLHAGPDGKCPYCGTSFWQRLRLIAHLSDSRWACLKAMVASAPRLTEAESAELDELDRIARRSARRAGHRHPLAVGSAVTAEGKMIGFAQRCCASVFCLLSFPVVPPAPDFHRRGMVQQCPDRCRT